MLSMLCTKSYAIGYVFDSQNLVQATKLYTLTSQQLAAANNMYSQTKRITSALDGGMTAENWVSIARNNLAQINTLFKTESIGYKTLAKQNFLNPQPQQNFAQTKSSIGKSLYVYSADPTVVDRKRVEKITQKRNASLDFAVVTSIAESGEQKDALVESSRRAKALTEEAMRSSNVHQDLLNTNKMLAAIFSELNQQRVVQVQLLELLSASLANGSAIVSDIAR